MHVKQHNLVSRAIGGSRFCRGTIVATHNTITDHTPKMKFQVAQIGLYEQALCKEGIASKRSHKVRSQRGGDLKIKTQRKRTEPNCQRQLSRGLLRYFHTHLVST